MAEKGIWSTELESERNIRHSSLYSRHSKNHVESLSLEISNIMTQLGYGEEIRRWRVEKYREFDRLVNERSKDITIITSGSKAEGLTGYFESDWDMLCVLNGVLCTEAGMNLHNIPDDIDVYRMDTCAYPGHCRLSLSQRRPKTRITEIIRNALCDNGYGDMLLSSMLFQDEVSSVFAIRHYQNSFEIVIHERTGPSTPATMEGALYTDTVYPIRCHCPSILHRWAARPRYWPPPVIVQKVVSSEAYVIPVGFRESEYKHMEWRICFYTGETELINNLNETQTKAYVLLKMILKNIIKPNKKEITSYSLKNIILWQAENTPQTEFHTRSLLHWLHDGLRELRTAIVTKQLRYYWIPERNLMAACDLEDTLQRKWVADITDMLEEGPWVILRLEKIRKAIVASPFPLLWYCKRRIEMEMLQQEMRNRWIQCADENGEADFILEAILSRQVEILMELSLRMVQEGDPVVRRPRSLNTETAFVKSTEPHGNVSSTPYGQQYKATEQQPGKSAMLPKPPTRNPTVNQLVQDSNPPFMKEGSPPPVPLGGMDQGKFENTDARPKMKTKASAEVRVHKEQFHLSKEHANYGKRLRRHFVRLNEDNRLSVKFGYPPIAGSVGTLSHLTNYLEPDISVKPPHAQQSEALKNLTIQKKSDNESTGNRALGIWSTILAKSMASGESAGNICEQNAKDKLGFKPHGLDNRVYFW